MIRFKARNRKSARRFLPRRKDLRLLNLLADGARSGRQMASVTSNIFILYGQNENKCAVKNNERQRPGIYVVSIFSGGKSADALISRGIDEVSWVYSRVSFPPSGLGCTSSAPRKPCGPSPPPPPPSGRRSRSAHSGWSRTKYTRWTWTTDAREWATLCICTVTQESTGTLKQRFCAKNLHSVLDK